MYRFYCNCVNWPRDDVFVKGGLSELISIRRQITRRTFLTHVHRADLREQESNLSYADHPRRGLTMAADWHVEYFVSRLHGKRVYGFRHSAIEYVFTLERRKQGEHSDEARVMAHNAGDSDDMSGPVGQKA